MYKIISKNYEGQENKVFTDYVNNLKRFFLFASKENCIILSIKRV